MTGNDRVLVVDDHRDTAEILAVLLRALGHESRTALGGRDALRVARDFEPDLVLLDIGLPDMDGYEVVRALRARDQRTKPYLVAITGWGRQADIAEALRAGFDEHLLKPISLARVHDILGRSAARRCSRGAHAMELHA